MATTRTKATPRVVTKKEPEPYGDEELVTVLYGYGRVLATSTSWLDDYRVTGGVIRDVPYLIAKRWKTGQREEGRKPQRPMSVIILPHNAPEADYMRAAGISEEDQQRMANYMSATDADALLDKLPKDKLNMLRVALDRRLNVRS